MAHATSSSRSVNPWLSASAQPLADDLDVAADHSAAGLDEASQADGDRDETVEQVALTGPLAPQPRLVAAPQPQALPRRVMTTPATWWWVSAHGGAGETTLAAATPGTSASEHAWPQPCPDIGGTHPVVLVARTHAAGLLAAQRALTEWAAGSAGAVQLLGLVLLADAPGRLPAPLRDLSRYVAGGAPRTWSLPWVEAWRLGATDPLLRASPAVPTPAALRRLQTQLTRLLGS